MSRIETCALTQVDRVLLRTTPMFARLADPLFEALIRPAVALRCEDKAVIFREGDLATDIYIVIEGWLKLYRVTAAGQEAIINIFSRGQSLAEAVALTWQKYPATAEAVAESRLIRLPTKSLIAALKANPDIALAMLASVTAHLHGLVGEIARLKGQNGLARIVEFLISIDAGAGQRCLTLPFEKQVLARHLAMQPESLSRTLRRLRAYGVEVEGNRVSIESWDGLRRALDEDAG